MSGLKMCRIKILGEKPDFVKAFYILLNQPYALICQPGEEYVAEKRALGELTVAGIKFEVLK